MRELTFDKKRISDFALSLTGGKMHSGEYQAVGIEENGNVIGGFLYDGIVTNKRCFMHCAGLGKKWLTKSLLWTAFNYPFYQLKLNVVIGLISSNNIECIEFAKHIGFTESARIKDAGKDGDLLIFSLHKKDCKWGVENVTQI